MGYETRMYLVELTKRALSTEKLPYANVISMIDLCKCNRHGEFMLLRRNTFEKQKEPVCYMYGEDGNTLITLDAYGDPFVIMDPEMVYNALEKEIQTYKDAGETPYRNYVMAVAALKAFIENFHEDNIADPVVLTAGY
jgi:hypothetical protein